VLYYHLGSLSVNFKGNLLFGIKMAINGGKPRTIIEKMAKGLKRWEISCLENLENSEK